MLFLMVETFPKDGIKIELFPTEFIKKKHFSKNVQKLTFFEKCPKMEGNLFTIPTGSNQFRGLAALQGRTQSSEALPSVERKQREFRTPLWP